MSACLFGEQDALSKVPGKGRLRYYPKDSRFEPACQPTASRRKILLRIEFEKSLRASVACICTSLQAKKTGYRTSAFHHEFNLENSIREQKSSPWGFSCVMVCGNRCTSEIYRAVVLSDAGAGVGRGTYVKIKSLGGVTM